MKQFYLFITIFAVASMISGCSPTGVIYTNITTPLDTNMSQTPSGVDEEEGTIKHLHLDIEAIPIDILWDSNAVGEIAKEHGMETVYYADLQVFRVLGVWNEYTVHVYGRQ